MIINGKECSITQLQGSLWHWPKNHSNPKDRVLLFSRVQSYKWTFLMLEHESNRIENPMDEDKVLDIIKLYNLRFVGFIDELDPMALLYEKGILS